MSTRATYQFSDRYDATATVYIHYDGYPEGAASYFYRALCHPNQRGCMATRMIRAVDMAELTSEHAAHSDTEYWYNLQGRDAGAALLVLARKHGRSVGEPECWESEYAGPLGMFIDQHIDATWVADIGGYHSFKAVDIGDAVRWHNKLTATHAVTTDDHGSALPTLRVWAEKPVMTVHADNWQDVSKRVRALAEAFDLTDVVAELDRLTLAVTKPEGGAS
jgi:hypothetical protein